MKKALIMCGFLTLLAFAVLHYTSLQQAAQLRASMDGAGSDEILVGVSWPFSDNQDGMDEGLILAQEEINARGVAGKHIRLLMRDDHLDRDTSREIAVEFARNPRISAVIGFYDDNLAVPASAVLEESHLLHIVAGANNTYMTSHGFRYLVRTVLSSEQVGRRLALLGVQHGYRKFATIAEGGAFGEDLAYQTGVFLDAMDARMVYQASYVPGKVDFRRTVDELKEIDADVILFLGLEREGATFIKTARSLGLKTAIVGSFSDTPEMHAIAGDKLEGVMYYDVYDADSPTPENRTFVAKFRRRFGRVPDSYAAQGYDALHILANAVRATGSVNSLDLAYAIRYMDRWEGANGSYKFDSTGELEDKRIYLKVYRGGKPTVIAACNTLPPQMPSQVAGLVESEGGDEK
jgi:branched-chain amino acid transport system substrate-binding protein